MAPRKKPADLTSAMVTATKGTAAPMSGMVTRAAPSPAEETENERSLAPLNFRVSATFRREFKTFAAQHDLKLNELLRQSFDAFKQKAD